MRQILPSTSRQPAEIAIAVVPFRESARPLEVARHRVATYLRPFVVPLPNSVESAQILRPSVRILRNESPAQSHLGYPFFAVD